MYVCECVFMICNNWFPIGFYAWLREKLEIRLKPLEKRPRHTFGNN